MAGVPTLADGRIKLTILDAPPPNPEDGVAVGDLAGDDAQCNVLKSDFRLSATGSDTVADTLLCSDSNAVVFGASNYEGTMTVVRFLDPSTGLPDSTDDWLYDAVRDKGTHLWLAVRYGKAHGDAWADGDEYELYHVITDEPQQPSDAGGYIKKVVPLGVQRAFKGVVGAS